MSILRFVPILLSGTFICLSLLASHADAEEINGIRFETTVKPQGVELRLTGVAVLKWARLFDVYAGGFYLPAGVAGSQWTESVAKRLELSYFRDIEANGFADTSIKLLQRNLPPEEYTGIEERLLAFCSFFRDVKVGDRYSINYAPDKGTELRLNGKPLGSVPGHDFAVAYFGIWLGENPISRSFRDRLLGS